MHWSCKIEIFASRKIKWAAKSCGEKEIRGVNARQPDPIAEGY